jgi:MSHA biogenesis protein MshM
MMYLKHFGLSEPPFKITPATNFFFSGANRGEILDALIYAITGSEGIIKITGEVGSGKTMLCRILLERLPPQVEPVYLANPSLSREEMLHAIVDALGLDLEGRRVIVILQALQNLLEQKLKEGKRVVILVDEAHAMPLDTLEELRLLYNMQMGDQKLLQIVLFGQPELNDKLDQPNMRQLKDRIVHHFTMLPLSKNAVASYLMFRMRAAGYRGSNIFSAKALALIASASQGLLRRTNILADKALLAAFVEDANSIEARHVQEAIRDSNLAPGRSRRKATAIAGVFASVLIVGGTLWSLDIYPGKIAAPQNTPVILAPAAAPVAAAPRPSPPEPPGTRPAMEAPVAQKPAMEKPATETLAAESPAAPLLQQRLDASRTLFARQGRDIVSIQLFYTESVNPARMEQFLDRAQKLGKLNEIYVSPVRIKNGTGYRVLYGAYPSVSKANSGMQQLPDDYKKAFAPALYLVNATHPAG